MLHTTFAVTEFKNQSGVRSWRVEGRVNGLRIRKNFPSREEANAERTVMEIRMLQAEAGFRAVATGLTDEQIRDAEAAFLRLTGKSLSLSSCVDFTLANYRAPENRKRLDEAIVEYVAARKREFDQDQLSLPQFNRITRDLKQFQAFFPRRAVAELTVPLLVSFLERGRPSLKTHNNRRGIVSTFIKFAFQRGWIAENPIQKVPHHRIRRRKGCATTLTAAQARELMHEAEELEGGCWVPFFALCLFAGIRPSVPDGEISRLRPEAISLENGIISISADVSKICEPRKVAIQRNLAAWLRAYPLEEFPLVVTNYYRRRKALSMRINLSHDVLRHTFLSMFVAKFRSIGEAAIQAGNSESIIRKHYLDLKSSEEAEEFFNILPRKAVAAAMLETAAFPPPAPNLNVTV